MGLMKFGLPLKLIVPLVFVSLFAIGSFAASVGVSTSTYQANSGVLVNVNGGFAAAGNGFQVVPVQGSASGLPAAWSNLGTVQTALTAGDWCYNVTVTIATASAVTAGQTYTVTVSWNTGGAARYVKMGSLTFNAPSTVTSGQSMNFIIDTGVTSFNAPAAIQITVA